VERLAVIEERDRLAREMHDSVAQVLAYLLVRLDTIEGLLDRGRVPEASHEVRLLRASGEEAYADVREAIAGLRTRPEAGAAGLAAALDLYVREFGDRVGVEATFAASGIDAEPGIPKGEELTPAAEMQLMRIAQEALANVRKHARGRRVLVQLRGDDSGWCLVVHDDGVGFDLTASQAAASRHHFGLAIMRERVESLGGTLQIETAPGAGTTVSACIPNLPPSAPSALSVSKEVKRGAPAALAG
jgi:signal transduction histidine kinase